MEATIVSFLPWTIRETKPGVIPSEYSFAESDGKTPSVLVVQDAVTNIYVPLADKPFPSPIPVDQLANSIVNDLIRGCLEIAEGARPAIFWVPGAFKADEILMKFPDKVKEEISIQNRWFVKLIQRADEVWAQYRQPRLVTDLQRKAALRLGMNKEWAVQPEPVVVVKCVSCSSMIESTAVVCKHCKAILRPEEAKKLGINYAA